MRKGDRILTASFFLSGILAVCAGTAQAAFVYQPEIYAQNLLQTGSPGLSSNERLAAWLSAAGIPEDAAVEKLQTDVNPEIAGILDVGVHIEQGDSAQASSDSDQTPSDSASAGDSTFTWSSAFTQYVTQTSDNDFYLTHDYTGAGSVNGSVFIDSRCDFFPQDAQMILHGHNMKGGAVFGQLNQLRSLDFLRQHPLIRFETLAGADYYVPYAVADVNVDREADNYFQEIRFRFDPDSFAQYTGYLREHSYYTIPVDVKFGDRLLLLSTCSYVYSNSRFAVCARKLRDGETVQQMQSLAETAENSGIGLDDTAYTYQGGGDYENLVEDAQPSSEQGGQ